MTKLEDLQTSCFPNWCPGCGNFGIWAAFKNAAVAKGWDNFNSVFVAGIGCHGNIHNFINLPSYEGLHGRALPVASGIKMVKKDLNVFVFTGDGDCLAEGGNHFIHACRRNHDLTIILHDNALYSLTTGQASPLTPHGTKTKSTPMGNPDEPISPLTLAISAGATFVARAFSGNISKLADLIIKANEHHGLSIIDVLQPCVTYNKEYTYQFFQENIYDLPADYDKSNKELAFAKSLEWGIKKIPVGILYQADKPTYESQLEPLTSGQRDISKLIEKYC